MAATSSCTCAPKPTSQKMTRSSVCRAHNGGAPSSDPSSQRPSCCRSSFSHRRGRPARPFAFWLPRPSHASTSLGHHSFRPREPSWLHPTLSAWQLPLPLHPLLTAASRSRLSGGAQRLTCPANSASWSTSWSLLQRQLHDCSATVEGNSPAQRNPVATRRPYTDVECQRQRGARRQKPTRRAPRCASPRTGGGGRHSWLGRCSEVRLVRFRLTAATVALPSLLTFNSFTRNKYCLQTSSKAPSAALMSLIVRQPDKVSRDERPRCP